MRAMIAWALVLLLLAALPAQAHNGRVALVYPVQDITVDGDLSDWPEDTRVIQSHRSRIAMMAAEVIYTLYRMSRISRPSLGREILRKNGPFISPAMVQGDIEGAKGTAIGEDEDSFYWGE